MQLSRQRASWEFVQAVTWGKTLLTGNLKPPPLSTLHRHTVFLFLLLRPCWQIYIWIDRCMTYQGLNLLSQHKGEARGGERGENQFRVLIVLGCVHTLHSYATPNCCFPWNTIWFPLTQINSKINNNNCCWNTQRCLEYTSEQTRSCAMCHYI